MAWNFRQYGTTTDPVHKSHLNELTGEYGCQRRFRYQRDLDAAEVDPETANDNGAHGPKPVNASLACGTAVHETIARALNNSEVCARVLHGDGVDATRIRVTFEHELAAAADGREIDWRDESREDAITERLQMIAGLLRTLPDYAEAIIAVEPGFIFELEDIWYSGHIDLVYTPRGMPDAVGIADWKTGKSKPDVIELNHGWEGGLYSAACQRGAFIPREAVALTVAPGGWCGDAGIAAPVFRPTRWQAERDALEAALIHTAVTQRPHPMQYYVNQYPARVHHVHLRDFVPYQKAGAKEATRPEDIAHYGLQRAGRVKYIAGHERGPAWLPTELHESDVKRLAFRARTVVGSVRMGRFLDAVREHCRRCPFSRDCLTGGYAARGDELAELERNLKKAGL